MSTSATPSPAADQIAQQLSRAVQSFRVSDNDAAFKIVDGILAENYDDRSALEMGINLATAAKDRSRLVRYAATMLALEENRSSRRLALANALLDAGAWDAAIDVVEVLLTADRTSTPALSVKIKATLQTGDKKRITGLFDGLATRKLPEPDAKFVDWVSSLLNSIGHPDRALEWMDRPWSFPLSAGSQYARARLLYAAKRFADAERVVVEYEKIETDERRRTAAHLLRARIARNLSGTAAAIELYSKVFQSDPANEEAAEAIVRHRLAEGEFDLAASALEAFMSAAPQSPMRVWLEASHAVATGKATKAIQRYRDAIAAKPNDTEHYCRFSDLLADLGHLDEMDETLAKGFEIAPGSPRIFSRMLRALQLRDAAPSRILHLCERFLAIDPQNEAAMQQRATALVRLGRRAEALEQYLEGTRIHRGSVAFWRSAAAVAYTLLRKDQAAQIADQAAKSFQPETIENLTASAEVYEAAMMNDEALAAAEKAYALDPTAVLANQIAARLWIGVGRLSRAWPHLQILAEPSRRALPNVRMMAQVAAGFRYLHPTQADPYKVVPIDSQFPDVLFSEIVAKSVVADRSQCGDLVMHVSSSLASGGAERQVALAVAGFASRRSGPKVEFVADDLDTANGRDFFLPGVIESGTPVHVLRDLRNSGTWRELLVRHPEHRAAVRVIGSLPRDLRNIALPLFTLFCEKQPAVAHLWQDMVAVAGGIAAVLAGVPRIILSMRSTRPVEQQRARPYFHAAYSALLQRPGISMIGNSASGARDYEDWLGLPAKTIEVVHNGYDFSELRSRTNSAQASALRAQTSIPDDALVLGGVMRCSFEKRPELWTETACALAHRDPNVYGVLVGDGPDRARLIDLVRSRGLADRIHFVGRQSPVEPWMQAMDVLFLSSVTEGLPNVLIESQAVGTPVATMRVGGAPETVDEDKTAVVIDEGTTDSIADALGTLLFNPEKRRTFGEAGMLWADSMFGKDAMLDKLLSIYARES
jgi:glycosyltransferase involved in cell wall biosynthesis/tetratricopeptide (TPR) repeat protein